jgi:hypothetical protein
MIDRTYQTYYSRYYEDTFLKNAPVDERDFRSYQEFKNFIEQPRSRVG